MFVFWLMRDGPEARPGTRESGDLVRQINAVNSLGSVSPEATQDRMVVLWQE